MTKSVNVTLGFFAVVILLAVGHLVASVAWAAPPDARAAITHQGGAR